MTFCAPEPWVSLTVELTRKKRRPVTAVIAYVGKTTDEVLKLRGGDTLVCDASPEAVRVGSTDASVLKRYYNDDVQVLSVPGLHAKLILGRDQCGLVRPTRRCTHVIS